MLLKAIYKIIFITVVLLTFTSVEAQKEMKYADLEFQRGYWEEAISIYNKLISAPESEKDFDYLSKQLALSNYYLKNYSEAHYHFQNIETKVKTFDKETKSAYLNCLRNFENYKLAKIYLNSEADNNYYLNNLINFPIQYKPTARDSFYKISSINIDFGSSFLGMTTIDSSKLIISLPIKDNEQETTFYDLYNITKNKDTLFSTSNTSKVIIDEQKVFYRGTPTTFTKNKIIFSGNISEHSSYKEKDIQKYNISEEATNLLHLFEYKIGDPEEFVLSINDENANSATPYFDTTNNILFFSSDRASGTGGFDIYYSFYKNESWSSPKELNKLSTSYDEVYPFYFDNHIYFSSKGHQNFGGLDIFSAVCNIDRLNETVTAGSPINLGKKVNSSFDDFSMIWNSKYNGYIASNRISKNKQDHLLFFEYSPIDTIKINIYNQYETPIEASIYYYSKNNNENWNLVDSLEYNKNKTTLIPVDLKKAYQFEFKKNNHLSKIVSFEKDYDYIGLKNKKQELRNINIKREPSTFTLKDKNGNPIPNADIIIYSKDVKMGVFETNEEGFWKIEDKSLFDQSTSYTLKYIDEKGNEQTLNLSAEEMIANKNAVRDAQNKVLKTTSFNISADRKKEAELTTDQNGQYKYDFNDNIDYEIEIKAIDYELKKVAFNIDQEDYEIERGKPQYDIKIDKSKSPKAKLEKIINPENEKVLFTLKDENGEPIPFADIAIYGKDIKIGTFESNEDGYWDIKDSSLYNFEGSYTIKYKDKNGIEQSIKIDGDEILSDNEALKDKNNQTISNTKFDVYSDREKLADITTDINGQYEYDFDDNIDYEIEIEAIDYELKKVEFVYEEDDFELDRGQPQYDLKIDKTEKATITKVTSPDNKNTLFTLRDSDGSPIPFADITIYGKDIKMGSFDTDEGGFWNINDTTKYNIDDDYTVKFIDKNGVTQTLQIKGKDILDTKQPLKDKNQEVISNTSFDLYANKEKLAELTTDKNGQYSYDFEEGINYEIEIDVIDYELQTIEFSFDGETDFDIDRGTAQYDIKIDKQSSIPKVAKATKEKEKATKEIQKPQLTSFENIYFDYNKSTLTKEGYSKLRKVVRYMKNNPTKRITIYGHTDAIGSSRYNEKLGLKRAKACEKYLNRKGVSGRISTVSAGKTKLINPCPDPADCSTEENRKNRRVEIFIQD